MIKIKTKGYAARDAKAPLTPYEFERREPTAHDVAIKILYCGICHSDIHKVNNEWDWTPSHYPLIPGHEIVGKVEHVGSAVTKFKVGDIVGVGCMVDSCRDCACCKQEQEQFCQNGATFTYDSPDKHQPGKFTFGGYSNGIVVDENFVLHVPSNLNLSHVAPLLCAGITTYSPLKRWVKKGDKVGVLGLGGLGHMAIKIAHALGAEVTLFTTSESKREDGLRLGAHHVVISTDAKAMAQYANQLDMILDTISNVHDINAYLALLKMDGVMVLVGAPEKPLSLKVDALMGPRRLLTTSLIGGLAETQEMLDFCSKHNIVSDVEIIPIQQVNEAYKRVLSQDVKYRFVIDMASLQ
jgi:uncharacterized zinc-type alcohol dehydrogenase-like protein